MALVAGGALVGGSVTFFVARTLYARKLTATVSELNDSLETVKEVYKNDLEGRIVRARTEAYHDGLEARFEQKHDIPADPTTTTEEEAAFGLDPEDALIPEEPADIAHAAQMADLEKLRERLQYSSVSTKKDTRENPDTNSFYDDDEEGLDIPFIDDVTSPEVNEWELVPADRADETTYPRRHLRFAWETDTMLESDTYEILSMTRAQNEEEFGFELWEKQARAAHLAEKDEIDVIIKNNDLKVQYHIRVEFTYEDRDYSGVDA